jgi:twitching motility protein PilI
MSVNLTRLIKLSTSSKLPLNYIERTIMSSQFQPTHTSSSAICNAEPPLACGEVTDTWMTPSAALERFSAPLEWLAAEKPLQQERKRYGFQVGHLHFLIKASSGSEVVQNAAIFSLPGSPSHLLGLLNLRGNLVPVFDLRIALGLDSETPRQAQVQTQAHSLVLILDKGEQAVGIVIDGFPQPLQALRQVSRMPSLPANLQEHVSAAFFKDTGIWLDFNHESFFENISRHKLS